MRKADRLFQLTNLLRTRQPITAEQISEELGVSVRTVYRYIDDLSISGIPVYGKTGEGYQLDENFELPPLNLTEHELDALMLGVKMVGSWTGDDLSHAASTLAAKIEASLPKQLKDGYSNVAFSFDLFDRQKDREAWQVIHQAIKNTKSLSIDYHALNDDRSHRIVYPLGLFYWGGKWTLCSWCTQKQDFRNFRLDRIVAFELTGELYMTTDKINLEAYFTCVNKK